MRKTFGDSAKGVEELLSQSRDDEGKVKSFRKGVIPMLAYFVSHKSLHRGNIILTLKQTGEKIRCSQMGIVEMGNVSLPFNNAGKFFYTVFIEKL